MGIRILVVLLGVHAVVTLATDDGTFVNEPNTLLRRSPFQAHEGASSAHTSSLIDDAAEHKVIDPMALTAAAGHTSSAAQLPAGRSRSQAAEGKLPSSFQGVNRHVIAATSSVRVGPMQ